MMATPSTSSGFDKERPSIQVPKNAQENRKLKEGHVEDNNEDIAYFNIRLIYPAIFFTTLSVVMLAAAIGLSLHTDYKPGLFQMNRGFIITYGSSLIPCNSTLDYPEQALPSLLKLFELNVIGNVLFRVCVCLPIVVRMFNAYVLCSLMAYEHEDRFTVVYKLSTTVVPSLMLVEAVSMAMFSIITLHSDFPRANQLCKIIFGFSSMINVVLITLISFSYSKNSQKTADLVSVGTKVLCCIAYCYFGPQFLQHHCHQITLPLCHSYVQSSMAYYEYITFLSYGLFHCTLLIDLREIRFQCYPRTCSGECEPVDPKNFEKGAKYEYCRAFEYNQRKMLKL